MENDRPGRQHFEELFRAGEDPWDYGNAYETAKYDQTLSLLPTEAPSGRALEVGCAEGLFTRRLRRACRVAPRRRRLGDGAGARSEALSRPRQRPVRPARSLRRRASRRLRPRRVQRGLLLRGIGGRARADGAEARRGLRPGGRLLGRARERDRERPRVPEVERVAHGTLTEELERYLHRPGA